MHMTILNRLYVIKRLFRLISNGMETCQKIPSPPNKNPSAHRALKLQCANFAGMVLKVVVRAEILPRDFLQTPGNYYF